MHVCIYVEFWFLYVIRAAAIVATKMSSAARRRNRESPSYLARHARQLEIDRVWRRVRAVAESIAVDWDVMQVWTKPHGLTRKALRLVDSEEELQSMLARLESILEGFTPGGAAGSSGEPISEREQEAVLHGMELVLGRAVANAALDFLPERPTELQPVPVSPVQPTELLRPRDSPTLRPRGGPQLPQLLLRATSFLQLDLQLDLRSAV